MRVRLIHQTTTPIGTRKAPTRQANAHRIPGVISLPVTMMLLDKRSRGDGAPIWPPDRPTLVAGLAALVAQFSPVAFLALAIATGYLEVMQYADGRDQIVLFVGTLTGSGGLALFLGRRWTVHRHLWTWRLAAAAAPAAVLVGLSDQGVPEIMLFMLGYGLLVGGLSLGPLLDREEKR